MLIIVCVVFEEVEEVGSKILKLEYELLMIPLQASTNIHSYLNQNHGRIL